MTSFIWSSVASFGNPGSNVVLRGFGDFTGDGKADLLLFDTSSKAVKLLAIERCSATHFHFLGSGGWRLGARRSGKSRWHRQRGNHLAPNLDRNLRRLAGQRIQLLGLYWFNPGRLKLANPATGLHSLEKKSQQVVRFVLGAGPPAGALPLCALNLELGVKNKEMPDGRLDDLAVRRDVLRIDGWYDATGVGHLSGITAVPTNDSRIKVLTSLALYEGWDEVRTDILSRSASIDRKNDNRIVRSEPPAF